MTCNTVLPPCRLTPFIQFGTLTTSTAGGTTVTPYSAFVTFILNEEMQQSCLEQDVQKVLMWLYVCTCQWAIMIRVGIIMLIALQERLDVLCNYVKKDTRIYRYLHLQPARMSWGKLTSWISAKIQYYASLK